MIARNGTPLAGRALALVPLVAVILPLAAILVAYAPRLPLWEAPDEPQRASEAYQAAGIRVDGSGPALPPLAAPDPPAAPVLWGAALRAMGAGAMPVVRPNPAFLVTTLGGRSEEAVLHGHEEQAPWPPDVRALHALRWLSAPFGALTVVAAYFTGLALFRERPGAATLAASVAWLPGFVFVAATLQPLAPAAALGSVALLAAVRLAERPGSLRWAGVGGASAGLAALCSPLGLAALPPLVAALAAAPFPPACDSSGKRTWRHLGGSAAVVIAAWALLGGWWYLGHAGEGARGILAHGSDPALARTLNAEASRVVPPQIGGHPLVQTFVGRFGWDTTRAPDWVYTGASLVVLLAAVGWLAGLAASASGGERPRRRDVDAWLVVAGAAVASLLFVAVPATMWPADAPVDGRGLLVVAPAWPALVLGGLRLLWSRRLRAAAAIAPCFLLGASLASLPGLAHPRYRVDPVWESPPSAIMTGSGRATFGGAATLFGYRVPAASVAPGTPLDVALYWGRATPRPVRFQAFVHLASPDGRPVAQKDQQPGTGWYPSELWQLRDVVEDVHRVDVPAAIPPGRYALIVGTYDLGTGVRYKVLDSSWPVAGDAVVLGSVGVGP